MPQMNLHVADREIPTSPFSVRCSHSSHPPVVQYRTDQPGLPNHATVPLIVPTCTVT